MIQALHAQYPDITQLIPATFKTNGYRRNAMASMGCTAPTSGGNTGLPGTPGASPAGFATPATCTGTTVQNAAVVLNTWKFGEDTNDPTQNGNQVTMQFVNPGAPSSPLSVSASGLAITVSLATDGAGALTSTAAQVVAALNADPAASAILWAATYRGNAGAGIVQPSAVVHLSDFLWAPRPGDAGVDPGYQVPRVPYQQYILRICKVCDGSKTGFFVYAQEHAREWVGPLVALETANRLLKNYGTDPTTTSYVDNLDIFIDPSINTDGGNYSMLQGGGSGQRRTMTRFCGPNNPAAPLGDVASTSFDPASRGSWGIDDNRGFSVGSLFDGYEGASSSCTSDTYAGPSELSQPEDKNEVALESHVPEHPLLDEHPHLGRLLHVVAGLVQDGQPRGAAVPVEGLAGGVLGGGPQDGQRDRDLPRHGRHPGPHRLGGRRAVLGRGQQLRRGLVQQEHHRLRLRVRRAPVLADLDLEQRRRPGLHAELRDRGSRRGPGVRRRHVRADELGARLPERHHARRS